MPSSLIDRKEMKKVFDSIFQQILGFVKEQMASVENLERNCKIKVDNIYTCIYLIHM